MSDEKKFAEIAQPHSWFLVASDLHDQASAIRERGGSRIQEFSSGVLGHDWSSADRVNFLLCGFVLENLIKSFLVYENPNWISNGRISKKLRSHDLTKLADMSQLLPYRERGARTLRKFEAGLESWARYPVALTMAETSRVPKLDARLWKSYSWLARAYSGRMQKLLGKAWSGPHGTGGGKFHIEGSWFQ